MSFLHKTVVVSFILSCTACGSLLSDAVNDVADNLNMAVVNQNDPETVRAALPAYLILLDGLIEGSPNDSNLLATASSLYAAYGSIFSTDQQRAKKLTARAREYGRRSLCAQRQSTCHWDQLGYIEFETALQELNDRDAKAFYSYTLSWLAWIRAYSDDWGALADLPKVEMALRRLAELPGDYQEVNIHLYLGILSSLRPEALGGRPEQAKEHFEKAIELSQGRDLSVKVEYARSYARLLYDRELHDKLLNEVMVADPNVPGLTLLNTIAQEQARTLLASADDYF